MYKHIPTIYQNFILIVWLNSKIFPLKNWTEEKTKKYQIKKATISYFCESYLHKVYGLIKLKLMK